MQAEIIKRIEGKKVAILGFGKEGISTYKYIRKHLPNQKLYIVSIENNVDNPVVTEDQNLDFIFGSDYLNNLEEYDLIIKSPGVPLKDIDVTKLNITSQIGLVLEDGGFFTIGITGSKGKSTTTSLIYEVLKAQNKDAYLLGNIGIPIFDYIENFNENSYLVIEMAALQLEYVKASPNIACLLNLFEEHLDFFGTYEKYCLAKLNIFKYQKNNDIGFYNENNITLNNYIQKGNYTSDLTKINCTIDLKDTNENGIYIENDFICYKFNGQIKKLYNINDERSLLGTHNLENIAFVLGVALKLNLDIELAIKTINNFKPLEHRMELVGTYNGITFYNDSIATIPEATIHCIEALKNVDTLIFGGKDRGISYDDFIDYLQNCSVNNFICMPNTGTNIGKMLKNKNVYFISDMQEIVEKAFEITKKGKSCLLSPAASSYNAFKNFEEKGRLYKEAVKNCAK
ncbi:MAG: UDP-N-acetylmuramoyl-L-alanine--D-glutamate ligase [Bacilli bacterium]|nr:UDP-N-acetylmuramoyl-L-alanine--D-glutamate ligase [Bacilli bacterium]